MHNNIIVSKVTSKASQAYAVVANIATIKPNRTKLCKTDTYILFVPTKVSPTSL
jgi:hypothetical protein